PVTNLPEGQMVDDRLEEMLTSGNPWAVLVLRVNGLDKFRELYGFVASDDVMRAMSLMMNNSLREAGGEGDFVGHLNLADFAILTAPERVEAIRQRIETRLEQSMEYFYPLKDRNRM